MSVCSSILAVLGGVAVSISTGIYLVEWDSRFFGFVEVELLFRVFLSGKNEETTPGRGVML